MMKLTVLAIVLLAVTAVYSKKSCGDYTVEATSGCGGIAAVDAGVAVGYGGYAVDTRTQVLPAAPIQVRPADITQVVAAAPAVKVGAVRVAGCARIKVASRWTRWSAWSPCTKKCGRGTQTSRRVCIRGGPCSAPCPGPQHRTRGCGTPVVHARWTGWTGFSSCSTRCGMGTKTRSRQCAPGNICGKPCTALRGPAIQTISCGKPIVPLYWTRWSKWGPCSRTCGVGEQVRTRACVKNSCIPNGRCIGPARQVRTCGTVVAAAACAPAVAVARVAAPVAVAAAPVAVAAPVAIAAAPAGCVDTIARTTCGRYVQAGYCGQTNVLSSCCASCYKKK